MTKSAKSQQQKQKATENALGCVGREAHAHQVPQRVKRVVLERLWRVLYAVPRAICILCFPIFQFGKWLSFVLLPVSDQTNPPTI
jgi:hypothetical protein